MARWRVYVKPFDETGTYLSAYQEITSDVAALQDPKRGFDNTEFDVGIIRNSGFSFTVRNDQGYYSDVDKLRSIFKFTRKNSLIKITWDVRSSDMLCGFFTCGYNPIGIEYTVFEGLLNDVTSVSDVAKQQATFSCLGFESLLDEMEIPFSSINNGDLLSSVIYACLNQAPFNERVTVSALNIDLSLDVTIDDKSSLENQTVGSVLDSLLLAANSVLYINGGVCYVTAREETPTVQFAFYGQASLLGLENIINIPKFRSGMNRVFNLWTWTGTSVDARDNTSLEDYGLKAKAMGLDLISDGSTAKIQSILDANRDEFSFPKIEMELETPLNYDSLALDILDQVTIDYPTVFIPFDDAPLPRYGQDTYDGTARYPYEQWALTLDPSTGFKITSIKLNTQKQTVTFGLRET